jgi:hypothetical protein
VHCAVALVATAAGTQAGVTEAMLDEELLDEALLAPPPQAVNIMKTRNGATA